MGSNKVATILLTCLSRLCLYALCLLPWCLARLHSGLQVSPLQHVLTTLTAVSPQLVTQEQCLPILQEFCLELALTTHTAQEVLLYPRDMSTLLDILQVLLGLPVLTI